MAKHLSEEVSFKGLTIEENPTLFIESKGKY
jgi:hypothetical protein